MGKILITGVAGFIGMHVALSLIKKGEIVVGIDNLNNYYSVKLKQDRLQELQKYKNFFFYKLDISNPIDLLAIFRKELPESVIHLAAQAGVRYSILNPQAYIHSNIDGFLNILESSREIKIKHLIYASSSSVYGESHNQLPFKEDQAADHPLSFYAATKRSNELMAHAYSHLYSMPTTGVRFFTVYGSWGRPDMAIFLFTKAILEKEPIRLFNNGEMIRDFTFIDDIIKILLKVCDRIPIANTGENIGLKPCISHAPFRIFNIGNSQPRSLLEYISILEDTLNIKAIKEYCPKELGDALSTNADTEYLKEWIGELPEPTPIELGIPSFVNWFKNYFQIDK